MTLKEWLVNRMGKEAVYKNGAVALLLALTIGTGFLSYFHPIRTLPLPVFLLNYAIWTPLFHLVVTGFALQPYRHFTASHKLGAALFYILFSLYLVWSLRGPQPYLADNHVLVRLFVYTSMFAACITICLCLVSMITRVAPGVRSGAPAGRILLYAIPGMIVGAVYLAAFYPAIMSYDSLIQWGQIQSGMFDDSHPAVHTWFMAALTFVWNSPAIVAITQILIMSLVFGYGAYSFERWGAPLWLIILSLLILWANPVQGFFGITLWKDIMYSTMLFWFTIQLLHIIFSKGDWLKHPGHFLCFLLSGAGIMFFRHNGFPVLIGMTVVLALVYRLRLVRMYAAVAILIALRVIVTGPVYQALHVVPADANEAWGVPAQQVAAVLQQGGTVSASQKEFINQVLPLEVWRQKYNPYSVNPIKFDPRYNRTFLYAHKQEYFRTWLALCLQNPAIAATSYLKQASLVYKITPYPDSQMYTTPAAITHKSMAAHYHLKATPLSTPLHEKLRQVWVRLNTGTSSIIWRPALYTSITILALFIAVVRGNLRVVLAALPLFLNTAAVAVALPAQDVRYLYANILTTFIFFLAAFLHKEAAPISQLT
ncbi:DUF6020 family protein [Ectobacillus ponti]|uniref:DUF6020 family protein n=1 Tax=Ectobacillus ponti TaxID=2961894 RepID=A0AA41X831_9BACI|nr:DUF6020 family protein [Ectobacillus ponti]MCP8970634.1 DUF6020 family protein [Ectobacillus ponti]